MALLNLKYESVWDGYINLSPYFQTIIRLQVCLVERTSQKNMAQQQQNVVLECDGESVIQPHIRSWHATSEELRDMGWDDENINLEQELYAGSLTDMELRHFIDIEVSRVQRNSIDHARILRYFNIVMGKIIQPEE